MSTLGDAADVKFANFGRCQIWQFWQESNLAILADAKIGKFGRCQIWRFWQAPNLAILTDVKFGNFGRCQIWQFWQMSNLAILADSKTQKRFLIPCPRHVSSWLPPNGETCKYAMELRKQKKGRNLERFCTYWYVPFCCVCLGCCAAEFRSSGGTFELPCIIRRRVHVVWTPHNSGQDA